MGSPNLVVGEAWSCWAIAIIFIVVRIFIRIWRMGWSQLKLDDGLMFCALFAYTAEATSSYYLVARWLGYSNSGMTNAERENLNPDSLEWLYRVNGAKTHIWNWVTYISLMWLLKACWIAYYARAIAAAEKRSLRRVTVGYVILGVTYLSAVLVVFCKCMPLKKQWQIYPDPGNLCYSGNSTFQMAFVMSINTVTNMYIMAIPLPSIINTKGMLTYQKIFLLILYSGGFLVTVFGILRCVSILTALGTSTSAGEWSLRESFIAVLVTNLPIMAPILKGFNYKIRSHSTKISSYNGSSPFDNNTELELSNLKPRQERSTSRGRKPSPVPRVLEVEEWDDDEQIMVPKPTISRKFTRGSKRGRSHDGLSVHADSNTYPSAHAPGRRPSDGNVTKGLAALDLVPKKEKSNMMTTVQAGYSNHKRWNWSRDERGGGEGEEEVGEGQIRVVQEFRFSNGASGFYGGPVAGR